MQLSEKIKGSFDIFSCYRCSGKLVHNSGENLRCSECNSIFEVRQGIPVLTDEENYWCNFPKEKMHELIRVSENEDHRKALEKVISDKEIRDYIVQETRVDPLFFLPFNKESVVLDVGCKWGGLTIPFSDYCKTIVGVDTTFETVKFLDIRRNQLNKDNIQLAVASALNLPFSDNIFDIVILNGVLEWLGYSTGFDATKDYGLKTDKFLRSKDDPQKMQENGIRNIFRVLKPGGKLMIGIENRYGLDYFFGAPEDHANLKFVSLIPRKMANWYMKKKLNREFRTYTHSMGALRKMLNKTGFEKTEFFGAFPTYRDPDFIVSLEKKNILDYFLKRFIGNTSKNPVYRSIKSILFKTGFYKYLVHSFIVIAQK